MIFICGALGTGLGFRQTEVPDCLATQPGSFQVAGNSSYHGGPKSQPVTGPCGAWCWVSYFRHNRDRGRKLSSRHSRTDAHRALGDGGRVHRTAQVPAIQGPSTERGKWTPDLISDRKAIYN